MSAQQGRPPSQVPEAAPSVLMDQRGNYWRVHPKGTVHPTEETWSMCPVSEANYDSEPVAIYRQGRDMSAQQMRDLSTQIDHATDDPLLQRAAQSAWQAWVMGRDMVTEAELLIQMIAVRLGIATDHSDPQEPSASVAGGIPQHQQEYWCVGCEAWVPNEQPCHHLGRRADRASGPQR